MIAELGHFALILAFVVALVQAGVPLVGAHRGVPEWTAIARPAALAQFALVALAFAALMSAFITSDFSVLAVFQNSHTLKPLLYKVTGVWGNHEGSLLLWILILTAFGAAVAVFGNNLPPELRARVLAVQAMIGAGFLSFILFTSNPFARLVPAPLEGNGLNPLLQDPGLAIHPPFLYLGYVGFSIAFSFAIAALIDGRVDPAWARWVRPWTLAAWCFLTTGITLGSWWAYYELGWGGFWFWDPVENASFMPWLAGTALLHSAIVVERRDTLKSWTILLAILTFSLSLLGTFIVRSGVLTSVHAFATDPARGLFILAFLIAVVGGSLVLFAVRAPALKAGGLFAPVSREGALVLNNLLLATAAATVLLGTLYPLLLDALTGAKISVGPPYFNSTFGPLMALLFAVLVAGAALPWKRGDLLGVMQRLRAVFVLAVLAGAAVWIFIAGGSWVSALGIGLGVWLIAGTAAVLAQRLFLFRAPLAEVWSRARHLPRSAWGMTLAHAGVGAVLIGVIVVTTWQEEHTQVLRPGESVTVAGYTFTFAGAGPVPGPNYTAERGIFDITRRGVPFTTLFPERRAYVDSAMITNEAGIRAVRSGDLYATLGEFDGAGGWATHIFYKPFIHWIWAGAALMVLGGLASLSDRRYRVGAPVRRRAEAAAGEHAAEAAE